MSSHKNQQHRQHLRIRSSKPKHPSKTWRIHADSTQPSPPRFLCHVIGTPNPLAFASAASLALRSPDALNTTLEWADWWSWKLKIFCQIVDKNCIELYIADLDDRTFWFEDFKTVPEDLTDTLLAKHQTLEMADVYNRRSLWLSYLNLLSLRFTNGKKVVRSEAWTPWRKLDNASNFAACDGDGREARWPPMNARDNPFGATKLERKENDASKSRDAKITKLYKSASVFLSFSMILFCFICLLLLLYA